MNNAPIRPFAFGGLSMGYAVVDDVRGSAAGQPFDISADGGIETVPGGGMVAFTYRNDWASFEAEPLEIHSVYRIET